MPVQKSQRIQKTRALVIKDVCAGESNKRLTLVAKDMGKLVVSARGARNRKSKFLLGAQAFCYCDFVLYDGGDFLAVTQLDLLRNFSVYYNDIYKLMYGSYFLELADKTVMPSQEANDVMRLLLKGLHKLENASEPKKISAAFQIRLLKLLGLCPETDVCSKCGGSLANEGGGFSQDSLSRYGGLICGGCGGCGGGDERALGGVLEAMRYIKSDKTADVFSFMASPDVLEQLNRLAEMLVLTNLEIESECLGIIKKL